MFTRRNMLIAGAAALALHVPARAATDRPFAVTHTEDEWHDLLTAEQFHILREEGTEYPGTSPLLAEHRTGTFLCAGCGQALFASATKFESGTGWPSFWAPLEGAVVSNVDRTLGIVRNEIRCSRCGGHLGHVFEDGPRPTGLRYCMNGVAMTFRAGN